MSEFILLADSGATKTEWKLIGQGDYPSFFTSGLSPYHMDSTAMISLLTEEVPASVLSKSIIEVYYYGTGCKTIHKANIVKKALKTVFPASQVHVTHDLMGAALALCGKSPGIACILGTGSNSCEFNGRKITFNSPGLGYILGDEGSGAFMGRKVLSHYLYQEFDEQLMNSFDQLFKTNKDDILHKVYREPYPNRYLASFAVFLSANRGHFLVENIIEDSLRAFFDQHISRYKSRYNQNLNFVGSISFHFKDKIAELCNLYGYSLGEIMKQPMNGLFRYHQQKIAGNY